MDLFAPDSPYVLRVIPSPNHGERRGRAIDALILHYTGMKSADAALARLCDPGPEVSAHYLVYEDGCIIQLVPEALRAWHAGRGVWQGESDMNSASIGVEIANPGHDGAVHGVPPPFPEAQIAAVINLCRDIVARKNIPAARVLAHSDIAPDRKSDPGEAFPWARLAECGVGIWPQPADRLDSAIIMARGDTGAPVADLQKMLAAIGYGVGLSGVYDKQTEIVVTAFQRRYRPLVCDGVADEQTCALVQALCVIERYEHEKNYFKS